MCSQNEFCLISVNEHNISRPLLYVIIGTAHCLISNTIILKIHLSHVAPSTNSHPRETSCKETVKYWEIRNNWLIPDHTSPHHRYVSSEIDIGRQALRLNDVPLSGYFDGNLFTQNEIMKYINISQKNMRAIKVMIHYLKKNMQYLYCRKWFGANHKQVLWI